WVSGRSPETWWGGGISPFHAYRVSGRSTPESFSRRDLAATPAARDRAASIPRAGFCYGTTPVLKPPGSPYGRVIFSARFLGASRPAPPSGPVLLAVDQEF